MWSLLRRLRLPLTALLIVACGADVAVHGGLSERQANEAVLALREAGLHADKRAEARGRSFSVQVAPIDETAALSVLRQRGLPRVAAPGEVERRGGLLPLPEDQRQERAREEAAALAQTLEALPGVAEARVHLAWPETGGHPTAAVVLRLRPSAPPELPSRAQALLTHAVTGLRPEDITVTAAPPEPPLPFATVAPVQRAGLLWVAPSSRRLALLLEAALLFLTAALLLTLSRRPRA